MKKIKNKTLNINETLLLRLKIFAVKRGLRMGDLAEKWIAEGMKNEVV